MPTSHCREATDERNARLIYPGPRRDIATILGISNMFVLPSAYRKVSRVVAGGGVDGACR